MKINTVLGPMDTKDMGVTLMHEHIATVDWQFAHAFPGFYDREKTVKTFCEEMERLKQYGFKTFVDATPINLGRDVKLQMECAERSGINILAATGLYYQEAPNYLYGADPRLLADMLIGEIEHGMEGTDAKPAFIKCATQIETENNKTMLQGVAIASRETGLPIIAHTNPSAPTGLFQKKIFEEEGVAPEKIMYSHVANRRDVAYMRELAQGGSILGCDQVVYLNENGMNAVADTVAEVMKGDLLKHIVFSCDSAIHSDFGLVLRPNLRDRKTNPMALEDGIRDKLFESFIPKLRERGITEEQLRQALELNPRRFFGEDI